MARCRNARRTEYATLNGYHCSPHVRLERARVNARAFTRFAYRCALKTLRRSRTETSYRRLRNRFCCKSRSSRSLAGDRARVSISPRSHLAVSRRIIRSSRELAFVQHAVQLPDACLRAADCIFEQLRKHRKFRGDSRARSCARAFRRTSSRDLFARAFDNSVALMSADRPLAGRAIKRRDGAASINGAHARARAFQNFPRGSRPGARDRNNCGDKSAAPGAILSTFSYEISLRANEIAPFEHSASKISPDARLTYIPEV
jgi:hypothetical protein